MTDLDELDFKIGREVGGSEANWWKARRSYAAIGRKLGVDEETVRLRLIRLRETGVVPTWRMLVNPALLGCREALIGAAVPEEQPKDEVLDHLRILDGVHMVGDFRGPDVEVVLYYPSDSALDSTRLAVERICGISSSTVWKLPAQAPTVTMRSTDWRILAELQDDAWRDLKEVATAVGLSLRTVQRRLSALVDGKAVYLSRVANIAAMPGLACNFVVTFHESADKARADRAIIASLPRIGASYTSDARTSLFGILCSNHHEADATTATILQIPGVASVRMRVRKEIFAVSGWLRAMVSQHATK